MRNFKFKLIVTVAAAVFILSASVFAHGAAQQPERYGRSALETMENGEHVLVAYDALAAGIGSRENLIYLSSGESQLTLDEFNTALNTYISDYPEHFWLGSSYTYGSSLNDQYVFTMAPIYSDFAEQDRELFWQRTRELITASGVTDDMSEYEKALRLHDTLAGTVEYDLEAENRHNAYGAICQGRAVCDGYSLAYQHLLRQVGIQSFMVLGTVDDSETGAVIGHAWNLVRIDGEYYYTDVTWDDQGEEIFYAYFNVTTAQILEDHTISATAYPLPECTAQSANYFTVNGGIMTNQGDLENVTTQLSTCDFARVYVTGDSPDEIFYTWFEENKGDIAQQVGLFGGYMYGCSVLGREYHLILADISLPFSDIPRGAWYRSSVWYVAENGLMTGTGDNTFSPDLPVTRAMLITILHRCAGNPESSVELPFTDVQPDSWYSAAVAWAYENGVARGTGDNLFAPDAPLTREQMAVILMNYVSLTGGDVSSGADLSVFNDSETASAYAVDALSWAVAQELIRGDDNGNINCGDSASRSETAAVLRRFGEKYS